MNAVFGFGVTAALLRKQVKRPPWATEAVQAATAEDARIPEEIEQIDADKFHNPEQLSRG